MRLLQGVRTDSVGSRFSPRIHTCSRRVLAYILAVAAISLGFLAGLKTIAEFDLGWQMATARWIVQNHRVPSVDLLSYTAAGQPWIYPVGAGLFYYALFLIGGYGLISCITAIASAGTVALLLRRLTFAASCLAIIAAPVIASRTTARAEMFTTIFFAAMLSLVWQQYKTGSARLWLLPVMMVIWVNCHPGFVAGLACLGAYVGLELLAMISASERPMAVARLRRALPWLVTTCAATLANPWGWRVFQVLSRQDAAMRVHSQLILEWARVPVDWVHLRNGLSLTDPEEIYYLLTIAAVSIVIATIRRQIGEAILLLGASVIAVRHVRFEGLFAVVVVVVGSTVFSSLARSVKVQKLLRVCAIGAATFLFLFVGFRISGLVTNKYYQQGANLVSFGTGLAPWFPERAAAFVEREHLPGNIFSTGSEGAFMAFRLGPKYKDYIDGRAIPFGTDLIMRSIKLKASAPDSPEWQQEIGRYNINVIVLPLWRYAGLQFFPALRQFCATDLWKPVYLDEASVVFLRRTPETQSLIERLQVDCFTAPFPAGPLAVNRNAQFDQFANAASVLHALGRDNDALVAITKALSLHPNSGYMHWLRGHIYKSNGDARAAEVEYLQATALEPRLVAPWSALASYYEEQGRLSEAIRAWSMAASVSNSPWVPLMSLGFAELQAHQPKDALDAFNKAEQSLPAQYDLIVDKAFLANVAHGRSRSWYYLGDLKRAVTFEEQATHIFPESPELWMQLAFLYQSMGRVEDADRARKQAVSLAANPVRATAATD